MAILRGWRATVLVGAMAIAALVSAGVPARAGEHAGSLDPAFGDGGIARLPGGPSPSTATDVAIQPDGRIVVVGLHEVPVGSEFHGRAFVARFTPDGRPDPSFGRGGLASFSVGVVPGHDEAFAVALQPDGRIIVAGSLLLRVLPDGRLDRTFGKDGYVDVQFAPMIDVAVQPDGGIVALAGQRSVWVGLITYPGSGVSTSPFSRLFRFLPNGVPDPTFTAGGMPLPATFRVAYDLAVDSDGGIVVAGQRSGELAVARYTAAGLPDPRFGPATSPGVVETNFGPGCGAGHAVSVADGTITVAGTAGPVGSYYCELWDGNARTVLARYRRDGSLDASWGRGGKVHVPLSGVGGGPKVAVLGGDSVVVVGTGYDDEPGPVTFLLRFSPRGALDPTFGDGGIVLTPGGVDAFGATLGDRAVVVAGNTPLDVGALAAVTRYLG